MTPEPQLENEWADIKNVFALLETNGRVLTPGEKRIITGQRIINGTLYNAVLAILTTFPDEAAPEQIKIVRNMLKGLPGLEPPGCELEKLPTP